MKILVIGASGASGRAATVVLARGGHTVTTMTRNGEAPPFADTRIARQLRPLRGDALRLDDVRRAVADQDAVLVTLGIRENPLRVRLFGSAHTHAQVRSLGTANVVSAMRELGPRRLVVQSTYGVGATQGLLDTRWRLIFALVLSPQVKDHERQEAITRASGLDWTLLQPVGLRDVGDIGDPGETINVTVATHGQPVPRMSLSRSGLAHVTADALVLGRHVGCSVAICDAPLPVSAGIGRMDIHGPT